MTIKIDFTQSLENENGETIKVPERDETGEILQNEDGLKVREVIMGEIVTDFLDPGCSLVDSRKEGSALMKIMGDIETEEENYTERSVRIMLETIDKVLENTDNTGKAPIVMKRLFEFTEELEERMKGDS